MNKRKKILLSSFLSITSLGLMTTSVLGNLFDHQKSGNNYSSEKKEENANSNVSEVSSNQEQRANGLVPFDYNQSIPLLVDDTGPIISQKSKISSLDWFGSTRWTIDLEDPNSMGGVRFLPNGITNSNWTEYFDSAVVNYALDRNKHELWLLSNSGNNRGVNVPKQRLMQVDVRTGNVLSVNDISFQGDRNKLYRKIQVLDSGNVIMYSHGDLSFDLYNAKTKTIETISYSDDLTKSMNGDITAMNSLASKTFSFLFSISSGVNIAVFTPEAYRSDQTVGIEKSGNIYFAYVNDNLEPLNKSSSTWSTAKYMDSRNNMTNEYFESINKNGIATQIKYVNYNGDSFPKLSYKLPDGRTLVTIYNKLYIFWPTTNNNEPNFKSYDLNLADSSGQRYRPIESWTTDTDNNVYAKFAGDTKIQKIKILGTTPDNTTIEMSTYYDLSGSQIEEINLNAKNFVLYNVYGYSGQIMLLNPVRVNRGSIVDLSDVSNAEKYKNKNYGLAAAIVDSRQDPGKGDSKGLLNTDKAFTKSSTFNIKQGVLENKLPSEITRNDLDITEGGFLTTNSTIDSSTGKPKYKQFVKTNIDDKNKSLKITVNIDQIPWFVNNGVMPNNIPPLTIEKTFYTTNDIESRVSWKNVNLDYDFKNTLPTKVTLDDVKRFDPFSINISSQQTSINGEKFPQKTYSIENRDDTNGEITIKVKYVYLPLDVDVLQSNLVTQEFTQKYTTFKKDDAKAFNFVSSNGNNDMEDITQIPQLKELSEDNLLPSSFNSSDYDSILKFINTDTSMGYPISKMKFNVVSDDVNGTLKISGKLQDGYYSDESLNKEFSKTYTGLNKIDDYIFQLNDVSTNFKKYEYRPSEINEQIIYNYFLYYSGFNSSDIGIELLPNDAEGSLTVKFTLDNSYPKNVIDKSGFQLNDNKYVKEYIITGFKTTNEYQNQYVVSFKDDNHEDFNTIKKYTPNQIKQLLTSSSNNNELFIGNTKISNEQDFAKNVVDSIGSNLKQFFDENKFTQNIYYNDTNGEITVKLSFNDVLGIKNNDFVFIQRFTGFAKGNQVPTDDIFSFKTQSKLFVDNPELKNTLPSELKKNLQGNDKNEEISKYISFLSTNYQNSIRNGQYTLEVIDDDIFGYLTIKIIFEQNGSFNPNSLLIYTVTYSGFAIE